MMKPGQNGKLRSRGRMNNGGGGGGKRHMPTRNQTYDSNGPDIRIRGNAHQVLEKYLAMARDASSQGDRVSAENYYQHAEHYFRVISAQQANNPNPNPNNPRFGQRPPSPADDHELLSSESFGEEGEGGEGENEGGEGEEENATEGDQTPAFNA